MGVGDFFFVLGCILGVIEYVHRYSHSSSCRGCVGVAIICKNQQSMRGKGEMISFFPAFLLQGYGKSNRQRVHAYMVLDDSPICSPISLVFQEKSRGEGEERISRLIL